MHTLTQLDFRHVLQADAAELVAARVKSKLLHRTKDIRASGNEVEIATRNVLRRRLPRAYYIGHGHIVSPSWHSSRQLDVVISDAERAPILFRAEDGTEYFTVESVYAIGEVRSSYDRGANPLGEVSEKIAEFRSAFSRARTPRVHHGQDAWPYRNPLFFFVVFVSSEEFATDQLQELYSSTDPSNLPNIVCFLDRGCIVRSAPLAAADGRVGPGGLSFTPEFDEARGCTENRWILLPFGPDEETRFGANWGFFYFVLSTFLEDCVLLPPNLLHYFGAAMPFSYEFTVLEKRS